MNEKLMNGLHFFSQVQFNLQLSEKEQIDRARVVLPFEHQGSDCQCPIIAYCKIILTWFDPIIQAVRLSWVLTNCSRSTFLIGNGKPIQIYDGRRSLTESKDDDKPLSTSEKSKDEESGKGEIIYFRDSEDEMPDSDEDPDDDLDI